MGTLIANSIKASEVTPQMWFEAVVCILYENRELFPKVQLPRIADYLNYNVGPEIRIFNGFTQDSHKRRTSRSIVVFQKGLGPDNRCICVNQKRWLGDDNSVEIRQLLIVGHANKVPSIVIWDAEYDFEGDNGEITEVATKSKLVLATNEQVTDLFRQDWELGDRVLRQLARFFQTWSQNAVQLGLSCNTAHTKIDTILRNIRGVV